ncbi:MAG: class I SAM-dependent methyltransferase [Proteobacteria bacterium]|nr:class I SAM-dependent methyltransferase [Pseudomonadota bacterium]
MIRTIKFHGLTSALALALISGCSQQASEPPAAEPEAAATAEATPAAPPMSIYEAAVSSDLRPEADRARDAGRKPAEVLEFVGIEPGMTVLDLFSGSGWYTELIAHVVGDSGRVIAHSNEAYKRFVGEALEERFGTGRIANVEILMAENNHLILEADSLDGIMLVLSFHDIYHVDTEGGWELIDGPAFLAELKKGLKPGGIVAVIDHYAEAGAPPETGESLHRIDPALVIANMEAAGFVLDGQSDVLRNPDDDHSTIVFAPEIRGKTDRFVMRFSNPE